MAKRKRKQKVLDQLMELDLYILADTVDGLLGTLEAFKMTWPDHTLSLSIIQEYDDVQVFLFGARDETEEEYQIRLEELRARKKCPPEVDQRNYELGEGNEPI